MLAIGLMSGTSMDGIDAALLETDGLNSIKQIATISLDYEAEFKLKLREVEKLSREKKTNAASDEVTKESTELHALVVNKLLKKAKITANKIDLIGYHGQSLYHNPLEKITVQIGDGQLLANLTKIKVINDFRSDDIKNGGQGAPLAPLYHLALANKIKPVAIVNCGGIANISIITNTQVIGFDTGPGNVLIDRYIRNKTNNQEFMDLNGKYGLNGKIDRKILDKLIAMINPYLNKAFPKSLDPSDFILPEEIWNLSINDACATLENFTGFTIVNSVPLELLPKTWLLAGGGWKNPVITKSLKQYLNEKIKTAEIKLASEAGFDSVYMEAELFAYLAVRSYKRLPISLPSVTGATKPSFGGRLYSFSEVR